MGKILLYIPPKRKAPTEYFDIVDKLPHEFLMEGSCPLYPARFYIIKPLR